MVELLLALLLLLNVGGADNKTKNASQPKSGSTYSTTSTSATEASSDEGSGNTSYDGGSGTWDTKD